MSPVEKWAERASWIGPKRIRLPYYLGPMGLVMYKVRVLMTWTGQTKTEFIYLFLNSEKYKKLLLRDKNNWISHCPHHHRCSTPSSLLASHLVCLWLRHFLDPFVYSRLFAHTARRGWPLITLLSVQAHLLRFWLLIFLFFVGSIFVFLHFLVWCGSILWLNKCKIHMSYDFVQFHCWFGDMKQ